MNPDSPPQDYNPARSRKLLMHRAELLSIQTKLKKQKLTLVPLALYNKGRIFKLELALGKTRRKFEKRAKIKEKDIQRELEHESVEKEW
jgi:SsrA-binding protein